jgi:hypothetical protein
MKKLLNFLSKCFPTVKAPTGSELALHYRGLSDVAFRNIVPADLTPLAKQCYDAEAQNRKKAADRPPNPSN